VSGDRDLARAGLVDLVGQTRVELERVTDEIAAMMRKTQAEIDALATLAERAPSLARPQTGEDEATALEVEVDRLEARLGGLRDAWRILAGGDDGSSKAIADRMTKVIASAFGDDQ